MDDCAKQPPGTSWEDVRTRVLSDSDLNEPCVRFAVDLWKAHVESVQAADPALEIAHEFSSPPVIDATLAYLRADVAENEAVFRLRVALNLKLIRFLELRVALGEEDGVFIDEETDERIVPELLAVVRVDEPAKTAMVKKVIASARAMAESNGSPDPTALPWPPFGEGIIKFAQDLASFIPEECDERSRHTNARLRQSAFCQIDPRRRR